MPSGPPAEPSGKEDIAFETSSFETCNAMKRSELSGSHGCLLSTGADGCLCLSAARVSGVSRAGLSSLQMIRMAALKLPSSSLLATVDAKYLAGSYLVALGLRLRVESRSSLVEWFGPFNRQSAMRDRIVFVTLCLRPPLFSFTSTAPPKASKSHHFPTQFGSRTIACIRSPRRAAQDGLAALGILLMRRPGETGCETVSYTHLTL